MSRCCYSITIADVVEKGYSLSAAVKEKFRLLDVDKFLKDEVFWVEAFDVVDKPGSGTPNGVPPSPPAYATLSYVWRDLDSPGTTDVGGQVFEHPDLRRSAPTTGPPRKPEPPTSVSVLRAVCYAAQQEGCHYLWMDKLCFRQDSSIDGESDKQWHMARMYSIYKECKVCLVAAGGMTRLPWLYERTSWIDRAWTLQEALAPEVVKCLFMWDSGTKEIKLDEDPPFNVTEVSWGTRKPKLKVGMADLKHLLRANLRAGKPTNTTVRKDYDGNDVVVADISKDPNPDPDANFWCFGYREADDRPIKALQGALERPNPASVILPGVTPDPLPARRLGIWRCITMRNARYVEDFVFATMGIFGVTVDQLDMPGTENKKRPSGYPEDEVQELLDNYLKALSKINSRADWFAVAPELGPARETTALPLVPDINFTKDKDGNPVTYTVRNNMTDNFDWYLDGAVKYEVDAPNGISVTAPAHAISLAGHPTKEYSKERSIQRIQDKAIFELDGATLKPDEPQREAHAIVIGRKARYLHEKAKIPEEGYLLLMLVEYIPFTKDRFKNIGYAWKEPEFVKDWKEKTVGVGLRGG